MALIIRSLPRRTTPDPSPGPRVRPEKRTTKQKSFVIGVGTLLFPVFLLLLLLLLLLILEKCWPSFTPTNPGAEIETKVEEEEAKREDLLFFSYSVSERPIPIESRTSFSSVWAPKKK